MSAALRPVEPFAAPVRVMLVGVPEGPSSPAFVLDTSAEAARLADELIGRADREHLIAFLLDSQHTLLGVHTVSVGNHNTAPGNPAGLFRAALLASASGFILAHNHPSGDLKLSSEDLRLWQRVRAVAELFEISVHDFIVVTPAGGWQSARDYASPAVAQAAEVVKALRRGPRPRRGRATERRET